MLEVGETAISWRPPPGGRGNTPSYLILRPASVGLDGPHGSSADFVIRPTYLKKPMS